MALSRPTPRPDSHTHWKPARLLQEPTKHLGPLPLRRGSARSPPPPLPAHSRHPQGRPNPPPTPGSFSAAHAATLLHLLKTSTERPVLPSSASSPSLPTDGSSRLFRRPRATTLRYSLGITSQRSEEDLKIFAHLHSAPSYFSPQRKSLPVSLVSTQSRT